MKYTNYNYLETSNILSMGWLSPTGIFYPCNYFEHESKAWEIVKDRYPDDKNANPEVTLNNHNYVKIIQSAFTYLYEIYYDIHKTLTQAQIDFLYPYMTKDKVADFCITRFKMELEGY